jgi:hypothetical protein
MALSLRTLRSFAVKMFPVGLEGGFQVGIEAFGRAESIRCKPRSCGSQTRPPGSQTQSNRVKAFRTGSRPTRSRTPGQSMTINDTLKNIPRYSLLSEKRAWRVDTFWGKRMVTATGDGPSPLRRPAQLAVTHLAGGTPALRWAAAPCPGLVFWRLSLKLTL